MIFVVVWQMALVPLAWCFLQRERRGVWWVIAGAFAVSWLADAATLLGSTIPMAFYPVSQVGLLAAVLAPRQFRTILGVLVLAGIIAVLWEGIARPGLLLDTVAAGVVVAIAWPLPNRRLRATLLTAFGVGGVMWITYVLWPGWTTWGMYQSVRAASLGMFCWAQRAQVRMA